MSKRIIFALFVLSVVALAAQGQVAPGDPQARGERNVHFSSADGAQLGGYLAMPATQGPHPSVLLIHEWWGLNHDTVLLADALAGEGFVVLAADAFRGSVANNAAAARSQVTGTPAAQIAADLDAAFAFLQAHESVDAGRIAVWGFCFGGTQSMHMGTRNPDLAAVVIFYGGGPIQNPSQLGVIAQNGPVLGIYGEQDGGIPVEQVRNFERALGEVGAESVIEVYAGVGHAFVKSDTYNRGGAAEQAWQQAVSFLRQNLRP